MNATSLSDRQRVAITGIGVISPNGLGTEAFDLACRQGRSGVSRLPDLDTAGLRSSVAATVGDFHATDAMDAVEARRVPRMVAMALAASRQAVAMAGLQIDQLDLDRQRQIGVVLGTGGGGLAFVEEQYRAFFTEGKGSVFSITAGTHGNLSSELSIALRLRGPSHVISTGCTSSTDALGYARMLIRGGLARAVVCGGADAPVIGGILTAFEKMRIVSTRTWDDPQQASRPFDAERDGFVLGEGAWMFLLEDLEHARARGACVLGEVAGYASTCDAYHRVQIAPDVVEPVRAMEQAIADAGLAKDEIGYVNLHGTSTEMNDRIETVAIKKCFGPQAHRIPMSSTKSMIGHPQGACGAAGVAATILALRSGMLHPTINLDTPDPQCDLDYIPHQARRSAATIALCNCIAFGSKNSALVVKVDAS